ncbi:MAG: hypothetical protein A2V66_09215 [Ignavibacteria bacterium RBG_13_36_8]|nr:MAG: hypothetical protein A2V66_09215 [Ignavibacteria bacterium RBG_13_36_8]
MPEKKNSLAILQLIFNIILAVATGILAWKQCELADTTKDSVDKLTKQVEIADSTYNQSIRDFKTREKFTKMEFRAYVYVTNPKLNKIVVGNSAEIVCTLQNKGKTQASLRQACEVKTKGNGVYANEILSLKFDEWEIDLAPQSDKFITAYFPISKEDSISFVKGKKPLFFYGKVNYVDVFDSLHYFEFCYKYDFNKSIFFHDKFIQGKLKSKKSF